VISPSALPLYVLLRHYRKQSALAAANKRVGNILKKTAEGHQCQVDVSLLQESAEQTLHQALVDILPITDKHLPRAITPLVTDTRGPEVADRYFFNHVMVNVGR
jgi:glycyl-tRNA synthetase beta chain